MLSKEPPGLICDCWERGLHELLMPLVAEILRYFLSLHLKKDDAPSFYNNRQQLQYQDVIDA